LAGHTLELTARLAPGVSTYAGSALGGDLQTGPAGSTSDLGRFEVRPVMFHVKRAAQARSEAATLMQQL
jgi:hypothetical protein